MRLTRQRIAKCMVLSSAFMVASSFTVHWIQQLSKVELSQMGFNALTIGSPSWETGNRKLTRYNTAILHGKHANFSQPSVPENTIWKVIERIENESWVHNHTLEAYHNLAKKMDSIRSELPPNRLLRNSEAPVVPVESYKRKVPPIDKIADYNVKPEEANKFEKDLCKEQVRNYVHKVKGMEETPRERSLSLIQNSFRVDNLSYNEVFDIDMFQDNAKLLLKPYCNLTLCDQSLFPFVYLVITHKNRQGRLQNFLEILRNSLFRCSEPPPWFHCLCTYVVDYASESTEDVFNKSVDVLDDHVRLIQWRNARESWVKAKIYNVADRQVPTLSKRSLMYHMDTDILVTSANFVDRALTTVQRGKTVVFPVVMSTYPRVSTLSSLYTSLVRTTGRPELYAGFAWKRYEGRGITSFYLYDDPLSYAGRKAVNKTTWGFEDRSFFKQFNPNITRSRMERTRYIDFSLWHLYHDRVIDWANSKDGITDANGQPGMRVRPSGPSHHR